MGGIFFFGGVGGMGGIYGFEERCAALGRDGVLGRNLAVFERTEEGLGLLWQKRAEGDCGSVGD